MSHIIAVLNQKGGVGKTTTAINLGAYLAKGGATVLIVDFDPQGNATSGLGLDKTQGANIYDVLLGQANLDTAVRETQLPKLYIVPANPDLAAAELDIAQTPNREKLLAEVLAPVSHDYVLIDCPPSLSLLTVNALAAASWLLIPVQTEYYALEGLGQLLEVVQRVRAGLNTKLELLGVVATMYDGRTHLSEQVYSELQKHFGDKLFKTVIPRNIRLAEAPSYGQSILEHDKWSKGARAYKQLAREVQSRVKN